MYNKVPLAVDSVGVNSRKIREINIFQNFGFFYNLVSDIAIMSKLVLLVLGRLLRSSCLVKEHVLIWNKELEHFLLGISWFELLLDCNNST